MPQSIFERQKPRNFGSAQISFRYLACELKRRSVTDSRIHSERFAALIPEQKRCQKGGFAPPAAPRQAFHHWTNTSSFILFRTPHGCLITSVVCFLLRFFPWRRSRRKSY